MYRIEISNRQNFLEIENVEFEQIVEHSLGHEGFSSAEIGIAFVDNEEIHRLNREFLEHDYPTDVLSFLYSVEAGDVEAGDVEAGDVEANDEANDEAQPPPLEGDIAISTEMARDVAKDYGWSTKNETILYLVHGLLHLSGYDDQTDIQKKEMRLKEREILAHWNIVPPKKTSIHSSLEI